MNQNYARGSHACAKNMNLFSSNVTKEAWEMGGWGVAGGVSLVTGNTGNYEELRLDRRNAHTSMIQK